MFYSQFILAKKGPLGTIWIAAHLERKLRKNQVADTDIGVSVDSILFPEMPIALRLSSHLLLGVVRIYSRKVNYLFDDCSEALLKVKQAFRSTAVDLPPEESTAPYHSITLPETFDLDDFELPDNENFQGNYVDHHISSKDQITLQDTMEGVVYSTSKFGLDERFGDGDASGLDLDEELLVEKAATAEHATGSSNSDFDPQASVQANASLKYEDGRDAPTVPEAMPASGIVNQQIGEYDGDNEPVDYAQAPCTPGLWEEPNLSNIQETSACDDHHEPENHSLTESAVKENLENASSKEAECLPPEQQHNDFEPHGESLPNMSTEQMLMDDLGSTPFKESLFADQVRSTSPIAKEPDAVNAVSDDLVKAEGLLNKNAGDDGPGVQAVNDNHESFVELQGNQENTCRLTIDLESNTEPSGKDNLVSPQDQAFLEPKDSMIPVQSPNYTMPSSDFPSIRPCTTLLNHSETNDKQLADTLQPSDFNSLLSLETSGREEPPSASGDSILVQGEGPHATETLERNLPEVHLAKLGPDDEFQVASNILNKQVDNVIEGGVQVDTINSCSSDFPAPEKLLSLPQGLLDLPKDFGPESTPAEKDIATGDGGDAGSNLLSGKKRSFTESSLTAQSLNLDESSGLFATNVTRESVLDDDDLLSSILVGRRSSVLKMKPTPPLRVPSTKRRRSAPKTGISKRKVLMDDNMVLHGDTIRQQLMNTEDIRRLRKKAPCTRSEISMIEKQFWEDELFSEAIFTGVSINMASLHNQLYDLSQIVVTHCDVSLEGGTDPKSISQNDEKCMQLEVGTENMGLSVEPNVPKENGGDNTFNPVAREDVSEAQPIEFPLVADDRTYDNNTTNLDYHGSQAQMHATGDEAEPFSSEHEVLGQGTAMEIDAKSFSDANLGVSVIPIEVESLTNADVVLSDTCGMSAALGEVDKTSQMDASLQKDAPGVHSDEKMDLQSVDMDPYMDISTNKSIESSIASEIKVDGASVREISEEEHELVANAAATFSSETDGLRSHIGILDEDVETRKNEEEFVNKDVTLAPDAEYNAQNLVCNGIHGEEFVTVPAYDEVNPVLEDVSLDERENPGHEVTFPVTAMSVEDSTVNNTVDDNEFTYSEVGNDTDFLNFDDVDDDDEAETAGDYMPDAEAPRVIDNSGWSSRTKAVAKYLQIMFDKEGARGRNLLPVNNLLAGKTRKEASRMFFETLVLKTKDYIHVEQRDAYENIDIFPRAKLLKSDF